MFGPIARGDSTDSVRKSATNAKNSFVAIFEVKRSASTGHALGI